jgi:hypothetical protein
MSALAGDDRPGDTAHVATQLGVAESTAYYWHGLVSKRLLGLVVA